MNTQWQPMTSQPQHLARCMVTIEFPLTHKGKSFTRREVWGALYTEGRGFLLTSGATRTPEQGLKTAAEMSIPAHVVAWCFAPEPFAGTFEEDLLA